jgi:folate-binding protein YgfZ
MPTPATEPAVLLRVTGADRVSFLHRMLTCDVKAVPVGGSVRGLFLTQKGRVTADFVLTMGEDRVELLAPPAARGRFRAALARFVIADDVVIEESEVPGSAEPEARRVERGEPLLGAEATEETLPQECGLDHLVSYTKGCFLGQEPVARLHAQGRTQRGLAGLVLEPGAPVPARGTPVLSGGKEAGTVTSAVLSPTLGRPIVLAILRHDAGGLTVDGRPAARSPLPFPGTTPV